MKVFEKSPSLYEVFERKSGPAKEATHYCPGCTHGVIHRLVAEVIDELGIRKRTYVIFMSDNGMTGNGAGRGVLGKLPDGTKLKKSKIRGVASMGMICSVNSLAL